MSSDGHEKESSEAQQSHGDEQPSPSKLERTGKGISLKLPRFLRNTASRRELEVEIERQIKAQDSELPEEVLQSIVQELANDIKKEQKQDPVFSRLARLILPLIMLMLFVLMFSAILIRQILVPMVEKAPIQKDIFAAIQNGADVEMLKVVFRTRTKASENLAALFRPREYYQDSVATLMNVMNDLKTNIFIQNQPPSNQEKLLLSRMDELLAEYGKINPFDGLEESQKRDLTNLARKLSAESYTKISDDVASLVVELKQKNTLVTKYLTSSDISLWLSILALALTVGLAFWQFRPKARKTQKELIQEALSEFNLKRAIESPERGLTLR